MKSLVYDTWANPTHPVNVYADVVKKLYTERCPVPTKLPLSAAEKRRFKKQLQKSDNPSIADIHAFSLGWASFRSAATYPLSFGKEPSR